MISDSLPPLLRGLGTTLILLTSALVVTVERTGTQAAEQAAWAQLAVKAEQLAQRDATGVDALAAEVRRLRLQLQENDLADEVFENPWFQWFGLLGTGLIAASFFVEWRLKRIIARAAQAAAPPA